MMPLPRQLLRSLSGKTPRRPSRLNGRRRKVLQRVAQPGPQPPNVRLRLPADAAVADNAVAATKAENGAEVEEGGAEAEAGEAEAAIIGAAEAEAGGTGPGQLRGREGESLLLHIESVGIRHPRRR